MISKFPETIHSLDKTPTLLSLATFILFTDIFFIVNLERALFECSYEDLERLWKFQHIIGFIVYYILAIKMSLPMLFAVYSALVQSKHDLDAEKSGAPYVKLRHLSVFALLENNIAASRLFKWFIDWQEEAVSDSRQYFCLLLVLFGDTAVGFVSGSNSILLAIVSDAKSQGPILYICFWGFALFVLCWISLFAFYGPYSVGDSYVEIRSPQLRAKINAYSDNSE